MKRIIFASFLASCMALLSCSENLTSSNNITTETRNISAFNEIEVASGLKVSLQKEIEIKDSAVELVELKSLWKKIEVRELI